MTAYVHKNVTPTLTFITNNVDTPLTNWVMKLATEYCSFPVAGAQLLYVAFTTFHSFHGMKTFCEAAQAVSLIIFRGTVLASQ